LIATSSASDRPGTSAAAVNLDVNVLVDTFNTAIREELIETNRAIPRSGRSSSNRWRSAGPA
jgi:hypothetical protein